MLSIFYAKNLACCCLHLLSFVILSLRTSEMEGKRANILIKQQLYYYMGLYDYPQKLNDKMTMTIYDNDG